jgi:hypothetical protein
MPIIGKPAAMVRVLMSKRRSLGEGRLCGNLGNDGGEAEDMQ